MRISALSIPCSFCGAKAYEICVKPGSGKRCDGLHGARMKDADYATEMFNTLVNS